jgi:hypothetical protein
MQPAFYFVLIECLSLICVEFIQIRICFDIQIRIRKIGKIISIFQSSLGPLLLRWPNPFPFSFPMQPVSLAERSTA